MTLDQSELWTCKFFILLIIQIIICCKNMLTKYIYLSRILYIINIIQSMHISSLFKSYSEILVFFKVIYENKETGKEHLNKFWKIKMQKMMKSIKNQRNSFTPKFTRELVCLPLRAKEESCKFLPPPLVGGLLCWNEAVSATMGFSSRLTAEVSPLLVIFTTEPVYASLSTFCGNLAYNTI